MAKQIGQSFENLSSPRAKEDWPRCDANFLLVSNTHAVKFTDGPAEVFGALYSLLLYPVGHLVKMQTRYR